MLLWWTLAPFISRAEYVPAPGANPAWSQMPTWQGSEPEPPAGEAQLNSDYDQLPDWYEDHIGTDKFNPDTDGDQISDSDELTITGTNPLQSDSDTNGWSDYEDWSGQSLPQADPDNDGLPNDQEATVGTNVRSADTDGDGLADGWEVASSGVYNPLLADSDGDGVTDYHQATGTTPATDTPTLQDTQDLDSDGLTTAQEAIHGTDTAQADTDGDGLSDGAEIEVGSSPLSADTDGDGLSDSQELTLGFSPTSPDTDGDLLSDALEHSLPGYSATSTDSDANGISDYQEYTGDPPPPPPADGDGDGLSDQDEATWGTNSNLPDTDGDGLSDGLEVTWGSHPLQLDSDGDGAVDAVEYQLQLDPNHQDTDGDLLADGYEISTTLTSPAQVDSDSDGLSDHAELLTLSPATNPNAADTDGDGLGDLQEFNKTTAFPLFRGPLSPVAADSDGDGVPDGQEIAEFLVDTDGAGVPDRVERLFGLDPHDPADEVGDLDGDGITNLQEYQAASSLNGDFSSEFDWDLDGMTNVWEAANGLDPNDYHDAANDPDVDYITNLHEFRNGTDPWTADASGPDTTPDGQPFQSNDDGQEWDEDWDGDGASNLSELLDSHTDPTDPDSAPEPEPSSSGEEDPGGEGGEDESTPPGCPNACGCGNDYCDTSTCGACQYNPPGCPNVCGCGSDDCDTGTCSGCQTLRGCPNNCGCGQTHCDTAYCTNCYVPPPDDCNNACGCMNNSCDTSTCSSCAPQTCGCGCSMNLNDCNGCDGHCQDPCNCWGKRNGIGCSCATSADCASCSTCQCGATSGCSCTSNATACTSSSECNTACCSGPACPGLANGCTCNGDETQQQCRAMDGCYCNSDGSQCSDCTYEGECTEPCDAQDCQCRGSGCTDPSSCYCSSTCNQATQLTINGPVGFFVGQSITFSSNMPTASHSWTFDGGNPATSNSANPSVTWAASGTYSVSLTVRDGNENEYTAATTVKAYTLYHQTVWTAPTGSNSRTTIGLGEEVNLKCLLGSTPVTTGVAWLMTTGTGFLTANGTGGALLHAGVIPCPTITVQATVGQSSTTVSFAAIAPSGINADKVSETEDFNPAPGNCWADMEIMMVLEPLTVSFRALQIAESHPISDQNGYHWGDTGPPRGVLQSNRIDGNDWCGTTGGSGEADFHSTVNSDWYYNVGNGWTKFFTTEMTGDGQPHNGGTILTYSKFILEVTNNPNTGRHEDCSISSIIGTTNDL